MHRFLLTGACLALLTSSPGVAEAGGFAAGTPRRAFAARQGPRGGAWAWARGPRGAVAGARGPHGGRAAAGVNFRTGRRFRAAEGPGGRRAGAAAGPGGHVLGFEGPNHRRARVTARGKGTVVAVDGARSDRFRATGREGFLHGVRGEGGGGLVVGGKKGQGAVVGVRDKETGAWRGWRYDPGTGGWSGIEQR